MVDSSPFHDLIQRVRAGDSQATAELVRRFEPAMRRAVQTRLIRNKWRRLLHPLDICQIVWADFFPRLSAGGYHLEEPGQLSRLLQIMARNHLLKEIDRLRTYRRGGHMTQQFDSEEIQAIDPRPGPSQTVLLHDQLRKVRGLLSAEEWYLAEQRAAGCTWSEIAAAFGRQTDALRVQFARAIQRIALRLCQER
jgi:DNA-directed RNA polymerase specialized sigma24 family protein